MHPFVGLGRSHQESDHDEPPRPLQTRQADGGLFRPAFCDDSTSSSRIVVLARRSAGRYAVPTL
jgi:hypothetical protein